MNSGKNGCIRAELLYSDKVVVFGQKWFGQSNIIRAKVVVFGQSGCIKAIVVVFAQQLLYSGRVVIFGRE